MKGLESVEEAPDEPGFANTLLQPHLWQVWDRAQVEGLEDVEETPDDLGVVAGHGRVPQVAHQRIDCNCGVVILTARHQSCCGQQVPSILSVPPYSTCNHQNIGFMVVDAWGSARHDTKGKCHVRVWVSGAHRSSPSPAASNRSPAHYVLPPCCSYKHHITDSRCLLIDPGLYDDPASASKKKNATVWDVALTA